MFRPRSIYVVSKWSISHFQPYFPCCQSYNFTCFSYIFETISYYSWMKNYYYYLLLLFVDEENE